MPKDLMIANGTYTNSAGEEKKRWVQIGTLMEGTAEKGPFLLLDAHINLAAFKEAGRARILVSVFDQKKKDGPTKQASAPFDDEIPF